MKLKIKKLNNRKGYAAYKIAQEWDNENLWCIDKFEPFELYSKYVTTFGVYLDNIFVGFGTIAHYQSFITEENNNETRISYIVNPKYRKMGIATELLHYLVEFSKTNFNVESVKVEILRGNMASINLIENNCFNIAYYNDKSIIYEKKE